MFFSLFYVFFDVESESPEVRLGARPYFLSYKNNVLDRHEITSGRGNSSHFPHL